MKNVCKNVLVVEGDPERLYEFDEAFKKPSQEYVMESVIVDKSYVNGLIDKLNGEFVDYKAVSPEEVIEGSAIKEKSSTVNAFVSLNIIKREWISEKKYCFNSFIPYDKDGVLLYGMTAWRIKNWGTESNIELVSTADEKNKATYTFLTDLTPPDKVVQEMSRKFKDLRFSIEFDSGLGGVSGEATVENGKVKESNLNRKKKKGHFESE